MNTSDQEPREYDCRDCGVHVFQYLASAANDQEICATCLWLREIDDPEEREALRKLLSRD